MSVGVGGPWPLVVFLVVVVALSMRKGLQSSKGTGDSSGGAMADGDGWGGHGGHGDGACGDGGCGDGGGD